MTMIPQDDVPRKQCSICRKVFPATSEFFNRDKHAKNGLLSRCKKCHSMASHGHPPKYWRSDIPKGYKRCPHCERILTATSEFFSKSMRAKDGLDYCCKECKHANWRVKHPSIPRDEIPDGYKRCSQCKQVWVATHAFFCKDKNSQDGLTCWCRECIKQYRKQHREERNRYHIQYAKEHKQERQAYSKHYRETYNQRPEVQERQRPQWRIRSNHRRARKQAAPGTLTTQQIQDKLKAQRYCCYYAACGFAKFEKRDGKYIFHIEHTIPLSRTEANPRHDMNYVVLACPSCNIKKHNKLPHEFFEGGRLF